MAVVGPGRASPDEEAQAEAVGRLLAERGAVLVCGGLGGVMEAACRGAAGAGGTSVALLPGAERSAANPYASVAVATGLGEARNALVVRAADALIAVGGGWGTLSEIALALKADKRVVGLGSWELAKAGEPVAGVTPAPGPEQAVELALLS